MPRAVANKTLNAHLGMAMAPGSGTALMSHETGIAAHVAIYLSPGIDCWEAYAAIGGIQSGPNRVAGLHVEKIHVSTGEIDLLADIHAPWGGNMTMVMPPGAINRPDGDETARIGDWVNLVRVLRAGTTPMVARTAIAICMSTN